MFLVWGILIGLVLSQIASFDTTIYLHRCATHGALTMKPWFETLCRLRLWLTTGQRTKDWVGAHRKHHALSDEPGDPHSPLIEGFWRVQLLNFWLYIQENRSGQTALKYASDIREGWLDKWLFNRGILGIGVGIALLCLSFGWRIGLVAAAVHALTYVGVLTSCVNAIGHQNRVGKHNVPGAYQNYGREDASHTFNYRLLSYVTCGEGLHNNHHGQPRSAKFSHIRGEFDLGWVGIRILERLGIVSNVRLPKAA